MYVTVTQYPQNLAHYAKNTVPPFIIETDETVTLVVKRWQAHDYENFDWTDAETVFQGNYIPDFFNVVTVDFSECYADYVKTNLPSASNNVVSHTESATYFKAGIYNAAGTIVGMYQWFVCNALLKSSTPFETWSQANFLTNQPIEKRTNYEAQEWLTYLDLSANGNNVLKVRFYKKSGGYTDAVVRTGNARGCFSVNVSYRRLIQMANVLPNALLGYYDVILYTNGGSEICRQRYIFEERTGREKYFLFVNQLGGIDTLLCQGENVLQPEVTHNIGRFGNSYTALDDTDDHRVWQQDTGQFPYRSRNWIHELLSSKQGAAIYDVEAGTNAGIVLTASDISVSDFGQLASASFSYMLDETVNVISDTERAVDRGLHQSVADEAEAFEDLTETVTLAMSPATGGGTGYETEEILIAATKLYIEWLLTGTPSGDPIEYDGKPGSFTPGVDEMPVVITKPANTTIQFTTEDEAVAAIIVKYYPSTVQNA